MTSTVYIHHIEGGKFQEITKEQYDDLEKKNELVIAIPTPITQGYRCYEIIQRTAKFVEEYKTVGEGEEFWIEFPASIVIHEGRLFLG
jgi:hypothetical protein